MLSNKWENFFLFVIILSIVQLFLEEYAIIANWLVSSRHLLIYCGFAFDLIFTLEFIIRLLVAAKKKQVGLYLKHQRGWIDLLASVPLLLLYSGPMVYTISKIVQVTVISQLASFKTLKLIKIIRISRILRLLRILKLFGKISKSATKLTRHHVATITTTALAAMILGLFIIRLLFTGLNWPGLEIFGAKRQHQYKNTVNRAIIISEQSKLNIQSSLNILFATEKNLLSLVYKDQEIIKKYEIKDMLLKYDLSDFMVLEVENIELWFEISDINKQMAKNNIEIFLLVIFILLGILIFYSRHFVKYLALPIDAIKQKTTDPSYSPQIQVNDAYKDDEVYEILNILQKKNTGSGGY